MEQLQLIVLKDEGEWRLRDKLLLMEAVRSGGTSPLASSNGSAEGSAAISPNSLQGGKRDGAVNWAAISRLLRKHISQKRLTSPASFGSKKCMAMFERLLQQHGAGSPQLAGSNGGLARSPEVLDRVIEALRMKYIEHLEDSLRLCEEHIGKATDKIALIQAGELDDFLIQKYNEEQEKARLAEQAATPTTTETTASVEAQPSPTIEPQLQTLPNGESSPMKISSPIKEEPPPTTELKPEQVAQTKPQEPEATSLPTPPPSLTEEPKVEEARVGLDLESTMTIDEPLPLPVVSSLSSAPASPTSIGAMTLLSPRPSSPPTPADIALSLQSSLARPTLPAQQVDGAVSTESSETKEPEPEQPKAQPAQPEQKEERETPITAEAESAKAELTEPPKVKDEQPSPGGGSFFSTDLLWENFETPTAAKTSPSISSPGRRPSKDAKAGRTSAEVSPEGRRRKVASPEEKDKASSAETDQAPVEASEVVSFNVDNQEVAQERASDEGVPKESAMDAEATKEADDEGMDKEANGVDKAASRKRKKSIDSEPQAEPAVKSPTPAEPAQDEQATAKEEEAKVEEEEPPAPAPPPKRGRGRPRKQVPTGPPKRPAKRRKVEADQEAKRAEEEAKAKEEPKPTPELKEEPTETKEEAEEEKEPIEQEPTDLSEVEREMESAIQKVEMDGVRRVLEAVKRHHYSKPFLEPVSEEDVREYPNIVYRPMDLGTITKRIASGVIKNKIEFLRDMYLTFQNAFIFNPKGSDIYIMASTLKELTKQQMKDVEKEVEAVRASYKASVATIKLRSSDTQAITKEKTKEKPTVKAVYTSRKRRR